MGLLADTRNMANCTAIVHHMQEKVGCNSGWRQYETLLTIQTATVMTKEYSNARQKPRIVTEDLQIQDELAMPNYTMNDQGTFLD